ncbi:hypothetical protein AUJ66_00440 [Candidatus Desantisbacteria bacterium CG1_02_38_46]|uniref:MFS transporter n=3 Tax=unclassified Candidatus Desantisiibacteriota TaxID=3106372 RepID=A0A2H9P9Q6_9BACT|nr:MAG: hypothetical protein AUJ66_00440 [Candidatus Desantisbacteria bacterium CG1_02_38_46]PIU51715.1 MAG: hypothetical protein COS91_03145 [Candidatus Desantisbacteria bacterium CG07_land_8_20_14_0_80_39_15]PIZ15007.1 MAG: hypothetical protein COY51_06685 [Candidatus Desantisbacteria bacterium CG_4_10_14_0_8_um_filter_39_17]
MENNKFFRRNFTLNILWEATWGLGSGFVVPATILVIFLTHFTSSKMVIGLLFTIPVISSAIAPIFSAYYWSPHP